MAGIGAGSPGALSDEATLEVTAGDGGDGVTAFHREKYRPRGGPDGGDGGRGGDVLLVASPAVRTLLEYHFHPHQRAERGAHGQGDHRRGHEGKDRLVPVPIGTVVRDDAGVLLADLSTPGARFVAARGGRGGRGNAALSAGRRVAHFHEHGEPGQVRRLRLDLHLLADAAFVGLPNAGKSSLLGRLSAARPKVAAYPFTTLAPVLGLVRADDHEFVLADLPGLVEGAAEGRGLGIRFLRHVTRAAVLVHVLDLGAFALDDTGALSPEAGPHPSAGDGPHDGDDALNGDGALAEQLAAVEAELDAYDPELRSRPRIVVANKCDLPDVSLRIARAKAAAQERDLPFFTVSALTGTGMEELRWALVEVVEQARADRVAEAEETQASGRGEVGVLVSEDPAAMAIEIGRDPAGRLLVRGPQPDRWVAMADLNNEESLAYLQRRLRRAGVQRLLEEAGAKEGDEIVVGSAIFEFQPDAAVSGWHGSPRRGRSV